MSIAFSRSMRLFDLSDFRGPMLSIVVAVVVLGAWFVWAWCARISLYEVADTARIEVEHAAYPIEAQVSGRVVRNYLTLGQRVEARQLLVELDDASERLKLAEQQTQPLARESQKAALRSEITAGEKALDEARQTASAALDQARAQLREAEEAARFAHVEEDRLSPLRANGVISELEFLRLKSETQKRDAVAASARLAVVKLEQEHRTIGRDREAELERLKSEITRIESQASADQAAIKRLQHEVGIRRIEAPVSGHIGELTEQHPGTFIQAGAKLGAIIPEGGLKIVAYLPPESALGRIQPGQSALLRLHGFPWGQYGSLAATVATVAGETKDGRVRVELEMLRDQVGAIPLQHGLPGTIEIEVRKASPLMLVMEYLASHLTKEK
ncbi:MAG TPA: HlyD family efflux transporter periplasmic adaptor subunit [Pyrinomonadaceae bacterium]|nr:HlyD family efflux transporter periplasmic adaptor subunit [Pyrinomonadaceae bacterium]